jgi:LemA protein
METWIIGVIVAVVIVGVIIYNGLVQTKNRVEEAWSDITVQLKRRADLIPNLIETVKGYAKHEKTVFENVTKERSNVLAAQEKGPAETAKAENMLEGALKSLFAVSEDYPDLKADKNFKALQDELVDTEDKIQAARRFYNGSARDLNIKIQSFPNVLVARPLGFKESEFFEVDESQMASIGKPTDVKF